MCDTSVQRAYNEFDNHSSNTCDVVDDTKKEPIYRLDIDEFHAEKKRRQIPDDDHDAGRELWMSMFRTITSDQEEYHTICNEIQKEQLPGDIVKNNHRRRSARIQAMMEKKKLAHS